MRTTRREVLAGAAAAFGCFACGAEDILRSGSIGSTPNANRFSPDEGSTALAWYVSNFGSDSNDGHSEAAPFLTLAKLISEVSQGIDTCYLARGSKFREALTALPQGITVRAYGSTALQRPIIDGSEVSAGGSWSKTGGRTNIYQISWSHSFTASGGKTAHRVWEDGVRMRRIALPTEVLGTALTALDNQAGAFWAATPTSGGPDTIYINASSPSDKNPASNGSSYEITKREWAVQLYDTIDNASIYDIHARRNAHSDGAIVYDGYASGCLAEDGRVHNFFFRGTAEDCIAWKIEPPDVAGGATMFITFTAVENGRNIFARRCKAIAERDALGPTGGPNDVLTVGFYGHAGSGKIFGDVLLEECESQGCSKAFGFEQCTNWTAIDCRSDHTSTAVYGPLPTGRVTIEGGVHRGHPTDDCSLIVYTGGGTTPAEIYMRRTRFSSEASQNFPINIELSAGTIVDIRECSIDSKIGGYVWLQRGNFTFRNNIIKGPTLRLGITGETLPAYDADENIFQTWGGLSYVDASFQTGHAAPVTYTMAQWRALHGQDINSLDADPFFTGITLESQWGVAPDSPARALECGADWDGEPFDYQVAA